MTQDTFSKSEIKNQLLYLSLVGRKIVIINSKIPNQIGVSGTILYETAKTLILDVQGVRKQYFKGNISFEIEHSGKALYMDGSLLFSTLQTRLKKKK